MLHKCLSDCYEELLTVLIENLNLWMELIFLAVKALYITSKCYLILTDTYYAGTIASHFISIIFWQNQSVSQHSLFSQIGQFSSVSQVSESVIESVSDWVSQSVKSMHSVSQFSQFSQSVYLSICQSVSSVSSVRSVSSISSVSSVSQSVCLSVCQSTNQFSESVSQSA